MTSMLPQCYLYVRCMLGVLSPIIETNYFKKKYLQIINVRFHKKQGVSL